MSKAFQASVMPLPLSSFLSSFLSAFFVVLLLVLLVRLLVVLLVLLVLPLGGHAHAEDDEEQPLSPTNAKRS